MPVITLISDWNKNDYYLAAIKGRILSEMPAANIIDITHQIKPFNTNQAAFVLRNSYQNFPQGSIHLILVNTEPGKDNKILIVKNNGHYFIGTDNGIFSLFLGGDSELIVSVDHALPGTKQGFVALDLFTSMAKRISEGEDLEKIGTKEKSYKERVPLRATIEEGAITGGLIYIDSYDNVITNISEDLFKRISKGRQFNIYVQSKHYKISKISSSYDDVPSGELLAIFNSVGLLEIAINNGNAARLLNLNQSSTIRVEFEK